MKKAIIFARCSTNQQDLEHQIKSCNEYCQQNNLQIVDTIEEFNVSAYSTKTSDRKELQKLLTLAYEGKFQHLVVFESSRLSRNHVTGQTIMLQLTEYNITVHSVSEGILNKNEEIDSLLNSIRFYSNQLSSKHTSQRIRSAKNKLAENCGWLGNNLPIGYKVFDGRIVIDESKRAIVIDMFETYLKHGSKATIKHLHNAYGISVCRVIDLVQNEHYIGKPYKNRDLYFEELRIIPDGLWDKCQQAIKERTTKGTSVTDKSNCLFESKLVHHCGNKLYISHDIKNGKRYTYYRCKCKCSGRKNYTSHKLDSILDKELMNFFDKLDKAELEKRYRSSKDNSLKKLLVQESMKKDLLKTKQTILANGQNKIQEALLNDYPLQMINSITASIEGLEEEINNVVLELQDIKTQIELQQAILEKEIKISQELLSFKYLYKQATLEEKKQLIRNAVDSIQIKDYDDFNIRYNF